MIVFIINIPYLAVLDLEGQSPVARDMQAPDAFALAGQLVSPPERKGPQRFRVFHILQQCHHCAELVHSVRRQALGAVLQVKPLEAFMDEVPYFQSPLL